MLNWDRVKSMWPLMKAILAGGEDDILAVRRPGSIALQCYPGG